MKPTALVIFAVFLAPPTVALSQQASGSLASEVARDTTAIFWARAESRVYQPALDGLETLAFEATREDASGKLLWSIQVKWDSAGNTTTRGAVSETSPIPAAMKSQVEASLSDVGEILASEQTGCYLAYLLRIADPVMEGSEGGFTMVRLLPKAAKSGFSKKILLFDEDLVLRRAITTRLDGSVLTESYDWHPIEESSSRLLLESVTASLNLDGQGVTRVTSYNYVKIDRWYLFNSLCIKTTGLQNSAGNEDLRLGTFVVNGKPIENR